MPQACGSRRSRPSGSKLVIWADFEAAIGLGEGAAPFREQDPLLTVLGAWAAIAAIALLHSYRDYNQLAFIPHYLVLGPHCESCGYDAGVLQGAL